MTSLAARHLVDFTFRRSASYCSEVIRSPQTTGDSASVRKSCKATTSVRIWSADAATVDAEVSRSRTSRAHSRRFCPWASALFNRAFSSLGVNRVAILCVRLSLPFARREPSTVSRISEGICLSPTCNIKHGSIRNRVVCARHGTLFFSMWFQMEPRWLQAQPFQGWSVEINPVRSTERASGDRMISCVDVVHWRLQCFCVHGLLL